MRAVVRSCQKLGRTSAANVVAAVCQMRIVGCIVLSLCSKLSPEVSKIRYALSVCLAFSLPLPKVIGLLKLTLARLEVMMRLLD